MSGAAKRLGLGTERCGFLRRTRSTLGRGLPDQPPHALKEAVRALDARFRPFDVAFGRRVRQHEPTRGVGPVGGNDGLGIDHVLLRLRHRLDGADGHRLARLGMNRLSILAAHLLGQEPFSVYVLIGLVRHHALGEETAERFVDGHVSGLVHGAGEEARVEQMKDRVLHAADILIDG